MATLNNDELNILSEYFGGMDLPQNEIDKRVELASDLYLMHKAFIALIQADKKAGNELNAEYYKDWLRRKYEDSIDYEIDEYIEYYLTMVIDSEVETSIRQNSTANKAYERAENDANAILNYELDLDMKSQGYTRKRWNTQRDERVRTTHVMADGQEVGIDEPFTVGTSEMMFPCDASLGATADEIINCRCVVEYIR